MQSMTTLDDKAETAMRRPAQTDPMFAVPGNQAQISHGIL